ncbi:hypothetical protein BDZ90DRAFT_234371 [Jaminaea rosea]|uniref:NADH dehydrogenase [ubiquinone] 1 alpha subcomplex assembly factor 3 n=1 Tax=Jaminaea rosea TaxID=1569628 RepID=A0A316UIX0_9BASI|nr:hypothetical protein BDZ90DRAFT_234371 [Jaminaea rosea]PWN25169.1 hypothetical protein BDZ90DRAFT_234371 [Jaminaea rosea]
MLESPDGEPALSIASISPTSITLSDGLVLQCPLFLLNGTAFMWDCPSLPPDALPNGKGWEEWLDEGKRKETWAILDAVEPKPEVLLLGTGKTVIPPPPALRRFLNDMGIQVDAQSSHNAASTFNVLQEEGRNVAIAVLPAERIPTDKTIPGREKKPDGPQMESPSGPSTKRPEQGAATGSTRSFSTSTRPRFAQTIPTPTASSSSSAPPQQRRRPPTTSGLTLQHFLYQSQALSLYRSYLRASRGIPNPQARRETIDFYRSQYFAPSANGKGKWLDEDLEKVRDWLAQGHRDLKMQRGSMMLGGDGSGEYAKLRGRRGQE